MKFKDYHPIINFIFFTCVIVLSLVFNHYLYILVAYISSFAYSLKLNRYKALIFNLFCIFFGVIFPFYYASYNHFGVTDIYVNFIDNRITLESFVYGCSLSIRFIIMLQWYSCMNKIFTTDKVGYLFGKVSPLLSLYFSIFLRSVPQIKGKIEKMRAGQIVINRNCKRGCFINNFKKRMRFFSTVIGYLIENFFEKTASMKNRGYSLKNKTHFSIYRFSNKDRILVLFIFSLLTMVWVGFVFEQTYIIYDPEIIIKPFTLGSALFLSSYFLFLNLPIILEYVNEIKFKRFR